MARFAMLEANLFATALLGNVACLPALVALDLLLVLALAVALAPLVSTLALAVALVALEVALARALAAAVLREMPDLATVEALFSLPSCRSLPTYPIPKPPA